MPPAAERFYLISHHHAATTLFCNSRAHEAPAEQAPRARQRAAERRLVYAMLAHRAIASTVSPASGRWASRRHH